MDFVKNLKAKFNEHNIFSDNDNEYEEQYDDDYASSDYDDYDQEYDRYDDYQDNNSYDNTYAQEEGLGAPEYTSYGAASSKSSYTSSTPKSSQSHSTTPKNTGNIYNMNSVKPQNKYKLNSILLRDIYDAKNVANLLMDKDTIVIVNFSLLTDAQKVRAMDFLDGVKLVTKSLFARFTENIGTYVPEGVELYGDFFSQIDIESFK